MLLGFYFHSGSPETVMAVCCLFPWSAQIMCSHGMPAGVGGWYTEMEGGIRGGLSVGSTGVVGKGKVKLKLVIYCSVKDETKRV